MASVLHIDDDSMVRRAIGRLLEHAGMTVRSVASGAEAMAVLRAERFDVALVDRELGAHDGVDLIARLRRDHPDMCLILLTGALTPTVEERATVAGATHCLSKTMAPRMLVAEVAAFAGGSGAITFGGRDEPGSRETG